MECFYLCCFGQEIAAWRTKEANYIALLKQAQNDVTDLLQQLNSMQEYHLHEKEVWNMEKVNFLQKINELQSSVHQKDVVTQQYKVYEENFRKEREQIQNLFGTLQNLEAKNEAYREEVIKLNEHITSYRNVIDILRNDSRKTEICPVHSSNALPEGGANELQEMSER